MAFITLALVGRQRGKSIQLPPLTAGAIDRIRFHTGVDLIGFSRILRGDDISHVHRSHGNAVRENARGQLPIEKRDFTLIPMLAERALRIEIKGDAQATRPRRIVYHASIEGRSYEYVETIHPREKVVALKSLLKR